MVQKKNKIETALWETFTEEATSFELILGRKFKNGRRKCDFVHEELPNPETSATIGSSYFVFDMANWDGKNELFVFVLHE